MRKKNKESKWKAERIANELRCVKVRWYAGGMHLSDHVADRTSPAAPKTDGNTHKR